MRVKTGVLALTLVLALSGCAAKTYVQSLFVSAVSLETVGHQFAAISEQVTQGCESRAIPVSTCDKYRVFGQHFQRSYPLAVGMWRAADHAGDASTKGKAEDIMRVLAEDLTKLAIEALGALSPEVK